MSNPALWPSEIFVASGELRTLVLEIRANPGLFRGVRVSEASRRAYPLGAAGGHVLGFVGRPNREDVLRIPNLSASDIVGKSGLEVWYEAALAGEPGEKLIEVDAQGEALRERFLVKPTAGQDLLLELDASLQQFVFTTLERHLAALGKRAGAVVAVDPRDGAVRALVSFPAYEPNAFGRGARRREIEQVLSDPAKPFFNRAISGGYPSGSTIKPILAAAALDEGVIDPERAIYDAGFISVPNPYDPDHPSIFRDWKALGWVDMRKAIAWSANVYFYTIGGGHGGIRGLGIERIKRFLGRFGWGERLGIDLPGEAAGLVPDPDVKRALRPGDPLWRIGDTYLTSIGQGDLQATPLQLAVSTAAIANGGTLWRPRLARAILAEDRSVRTEFAPEVIRAKVASDEALGVVREGMREAVLDGSARGLADLFVPAAGKTGTAQTGVVGKNHGWFIGFAPYDNPELALAVLVEEGTGGSTDAVPLAREILYYYFAYRR